MDRLDLDRLRDILWPPGRDGSPGDVYALLDGARDCRIYAMLRRSHLDYRCLYAGVLPRELAEVAPYLVPLARDSPLTAELLRLGWGNAWGIFIVTTAMLTDLRRHFRRFLRVRDESGRNLIFRFYDPRVMRAYLPTCNAEELIFLFGPIDRYFVEGDTDETLLTFHRDGPRLVQGVAVLRWPPAGAPPRYAAVQEEPAMSY